MDAVLEYIPHLGTGLLGALLTTVGFLVVLYVRSRKDLAAARKTEAEARKVDAETADAEQEREHREGDHVFESLQRAFVTIDGLAEKVATLTTRQTELLEKEQMCRLEQISMRKAMLEQDAKIAAQDTTIKTMKGRIDELERRPGGAA